MRQLSEHARAAKAIRQAMKVHGIPGRVTSSSFSMGDSVDVTINDQPPWVAEALESFAGRYQYGHFNGMEDIYEYTNQNEDLPQSKFVHVSNLFSDEMRQRAYDFLRKTYSIFDECPAEYDQAANLLIENDWVSRHVGRVLGGYEDAMCSPTCPRFWIKPRIKLEVAV